MIFCINQEKRKNKHENQPGSVCEITEILIHYCLRNHDYNVKWEPVIFNYLVILY